MTRISCRSCGATVDLATDRTTGDRVVLETFPDASSDAQRYRITGLLPLTVEPVTGSAPGDFRADHLFDCPGAGAGRNGGR